MADLFLRLTGARPASGVAGAVGIGIAAGLLAAGLARAGALRAALLGTASGLLFGLVSALTKGAVEVLQDDGADVLLNWHLLRWSWSASRG